MRSKGLLIAGKLLILSMVFFLVFTTIIPRFRTIADLSERKKTLQIRKAELSAENEKLSEEIERINSPATVERIAREQLGMVKDGEKPVMTAIPEKTD